jgi:glycerol-3-phosphate dehydrogenase
MFQRNLDALANRSFDLLVIGGGICGAAGASAGATGGEGS